ncbi:relaxase/mobilization nuclease domain-containing protein [Aquibium sp. LZ166]|uniref:Relaxase/mobilization nuclease domain-containing protein n=1 Tax=Aquibium pacificus TaxID=3153579 RepID=A0ABV3SSJ1_9HYPH
MVPDIAGTGHSFKGACSYYLHDKRQDEASPHPETAERVAWTETRNLATDDPAIAERAMIATARSADELKASAGIKATGRKSAAHVYAYSLAWHPDEAGQLDRAEMLRAVDGSLKALGAENRQALIVCHTDRAHPHVHVIVNRVDPINGKMLTTSNDRLKLSDWANAYERERGQIVTPKREEKRQLREQFADKAQRRQYAAQKRAEAARQGEREKNPAAALKAFSDQQKGQHKQEWRDLSASNKAARDRIYADSAAAIREAAARHKVECKPIWATYFREARQAEKAFTTREQSIAGVIRNAMDATAHQKVSGQLENRGTLSATFGNVLSSQARARAFAERQDMNRQQMAARLKSVLEHEVQTIKEQRARGLVAQRAAFDQARADLIEKQDVERGKIRQAWKQIYADREADQGGDRGQHRARMQTRNAIHRPDNPARQKWQDRRSERAAWKARKAQQDAAPVQEQKPMKDRFDNARRLDKPAPIATKQAYISQAQPAPSPSGDAPKPAPKRLQTIPEKKPEMPAMKRLADAKRDWTPATAKPSPQTKKQQEFQQNAPSVTQPGEMKRLPTRSNDRDREPER